jgi:hypothetical protein
MRTLFSVLALGLSALSFQSCEVYPSRTSGGYYNGGYSGGGYYDGGGYGPTVAVSSGSRDYDHRYRYSNGYYSAESDNVHRSAQANREAQVSRHAPVNRNAQVKRSTQTKRNPHVNRASSNSSKSDHKQQ